MTKNSNAYQPLTAAVFHILLALVEWEKTRLCHYERRGSPNQRAY